jgi:Uma2 family endonuclease
MSIDPHVPPDEYLEIDRNSETRHEYMFGEMVQVPGGSPSHSLIAANICIALGKRLQGSRCRVFGSSLRVCLDPASSFYVYPDLTIIEGDVQCLEYADETVTNPKVVVEVLSPRSRNIELGGKARMYLRVASLTELLMIDQDRIAVEHWVRCEGEWKMTVLEDRGAVLKMESVGCEVPLAEIYAGQGSRGPTEVK